MPVRIYDIAKKLGIESKEVLAKAKELGITSARVPSSSLDKITAEFLESNLAASRPAPPRAPPAPEPIVLVRPPEPPPQEVKPDVPPVVAEPEVIAPVNDTGAAAEPPPLEDRVEAKSAPPTPPVPPPSRIGEKVGFIQLPGCALCVVSGRLDSFSARGGTKRATRFFDWA